MQIPENKIEEIRSAADIVDIISEYVPLRKRGKNFIGLCPFHNEKTPSFTVSDEKQIYHCFGCHAGGNVFKFLMEYNKISFVESVQELAAQLGISAAGGLEYDEKQFQEKQSEQEILYDINTEAAKYFSDNLLNKTEGEIAREYFQKRKIKPQTMRAFGLGYALNGWNNFIEFAKEKKVDLEKSIQLGLIGKNNSGKLFDKFSSRIIFPIFSPNGRVIAFAGRILDSAEASAKYLNSPESLIYHKGRILYGLSHAKDEIRRLDKAIIVEGYMDLISLYQNGIKNVVAVSGTALTEEQVQLLSRYTKNIVLLFDADTAGIKASMRSIELLLKKDLEIKIVSLPKDEDPDSFINNFGKEKFEELILNAQNFLEYQTAYYESLGMFNDPAKAAEAIRELVLPLALINDELKRNLLLKSIAKKFNLREKLLESELEKAIGKTNRQVLSEQRIKERKLINAEENQSANKINVEPFLYNLEKDIIKFLFEGNEEIIELIINYIKEEELLIAIHQKLFNIVREAYENDEDFIVGALLEKINDEDLQKYILEITFDKYSISKSWDDINPGPSKEKIMMKGARDSLTKFKTSLIDKEIKQNLKKMESTSEEDEKIELMKINRDLKKIKIQIKEELNSSTIS